MAKTDGMREWPSATVSSNDLMLLIKKLHDAMDLGEPFQMVINFDGRRIRNVKGDFTLMRDGEEVCRVLSPRSPH